MPGSDGAPARVVTVFRSRLRPGVAEDYGELSASVTALARTMPGFVEVKTFEAPDGERLTLVTFADRASHEAWRDHPEHRRAQRLGVEQLYAEYRIVVGRVEHDAAFIHVEGPASGADI